MLVYFIFVKLKMIIIQMLRLNLEKESETYIELLISNLTALAAFRFPVTYVLSAGKSTPETWTRSGARVL